MKWISILFILNILYYIIFYSHIEQEIQDKIKKYDSQKFLLIDIIFYFIKTLYPFWILVLPNTIYKLLISIVFIITIFLRLFFGKIKILEILLSIIEITLLIFILLH